MKKRVNENTTTINKNTTRITSTTYVYHNHLKIKKKAPHSPLSTVLKRELLEIKRSMEVQVKVWRYRRRYGGVGRICQQNFKKIPYPHTPHCNHFSVSPTPRHHPPPAGCVMAHNNYWI